MNPKKGFRPPLSTKDTKMCLMVGCDLQRKDRGSSAGDIMKEEGTTFRFK
jgi:hypothetical protein